MSAMETFLVKPKSYKDASRVTFVKLVFRYSSRGNKEEVKRNILPLQPVQILPDVDNRRDFLPIFLLPKLEMTGRIRRGYDRKRNKQLYSKPRKSTSTGSLLLFFCYLSYTEFILPVFTDGHYSQRISENRWS